MKLTSARVALVVLAGLAVVLGYNLLSATRSYVSAYDAYDRLAIEPDTFRYTSPNDPVDITVNVANPTAQALEIEALELTLNAGVHGVGGGQVTTPTRLGPRQQDQLQVVANINDPHYIEQLPNQPIDWHITGRILVRLYSQAKPIWISFSTRVVATPT